METVRWEQHHPRKSQAKQGKNSGPSNWHEHYWARSGSGEHRRRQWLGMRSMHWYRGGDTLSGERTQCRHDGWHDLTMSWHWHCGGVDLVHPPHRSQHGHVLLCLLLSPTPPPSSSCPVAAERSSGWEEEAVAKKAVATTMRTRLNTTRLYLISSSSISAFAFFLCQVSAALPWVYPRAEVACFMEWVGALVIDACDFLFGRQPSISTSGELIQNEGSDDSTTQLATTNRRCFRVHGRSVGGLGFTRGFDSRDRESRAKFER
ncbi:hypothetical protein BHE74_00011258 [Ensete ventricosum]|nr:hypothetical protein BHE74_00011258 [Ensete ventricosum]